MIIKHFRPIALCIVMYKVVNKLIANRIKTILRSLVGPHQTSFVPRRKMIDNIIIA